MAQHVSMCYTLQLCGWAITYKRLGPPGTIHTILQKSRHQRKGAFASNTYGINGVHPQAYQNARISTFPIRNHIGRFTVRAWRLYRDPILNKQRCAAILQQVIVQCLPFLHLPNTGLPRSNAVHTLPWPAYWLSCTPSTIRGRPRWMPDKVLWPTSGSHGAVIAW